MLTPVTNTHTIPAPSTNVGGGETSSLHSSPCVHESDLAILNQAILDIKDNLTYLRDLMTSNAILEEQVSTLNREMKTVKHEMDEVRIMQAKASGSSVWIEKICWGLVALALGAVIGAITR